MRIGVAGQQRRLEEDHAGAPDRRRAAEQWEDHLGDHRLDAEQEESAEKQGEEE